MAVSDAEETVLPDLRGLSIVEGKTSLFLSLAEDPFHVSFDSGLGNFRNDSGVLFDLIFSAEDNESRRFVEDLEPADRRLT